MKRAVRRDHSVAVAAGAILALAVLPRFIGIGWGLPHVFSADEPSLIDSALAGAGISGFLSFKYPALWPALLAACYGVWFALWSGFGYLRGAADFAAQYAFDPTGFHLIARVLAALAQLAALAVIARGEREKVPGRWPYGAALLAFSPVLVELAHSAKPDSLALLFVAGAYAAALRFQGGGRKAWLLSAGVLAGAACSTHYAALPAGLAVLLAWLLRVGGPAPFAWLVQAGLSAAAGFVVGTPEALIEPVRFAADWSDAADLGRLRSHDAVAAARRVAKDLWCFGGEGTLGGGAGLLGLFALARRQTRRALLLLIPIGTGAFMAAASQDAGPPSFLLGISPALALLAGEGFSLLGGASAARRGLAAVLVLAPGLYLTGGYLAELRRPDTRAEAAAWLEGAVPAGAAVLLDQPSLGPRVIPSKEQCLALAERAEKTGSPRAALYRLMAAKHPGGGWRVYRIQRTGRELWSAPRAAAAPADSEPLDVRPGLDLLRAARIEWVVTTSYGADPRRSRELATFFSELAEQADLVREFPAGPGVAAGPWLRAYRLRR